MNVLTTRPREIGNYEPGENDSAPKKLKDTRRRIIMYVNVPPPPHTHTATASSVTRPILT